MKNIYPILNLIMNDKQIRGKEREREREKKESVCVRERVIEQG